MTNSTDKPTKARDLKVSELLEYMMNDSRYPDGEGSVIEDIEKVCDMYDLEQLLSKRD